MYYTVRPLQRLHAEPLSLSKGDDIVLPLQECKKVHNLQAVGSIPTPATAHHTVHCCRHSKRDTLEYDEGPITVVRVEMRRMARLHPFLVELNNELLLCLRSSKP